jgi:hypothetical protein
LVRYPGALSGLTAETMGCLTEDPAISATLSAMSFGVEKHAVVEFR